MILKCDCQETRKGERAGADYQDTKYGPGRRVHTPATDSQKKRVWRCTICTTERKAIL